MAGTVSVKDLTTITNAEAADSASWDDLGAGGGSSQDSTEAPFQGAPECRARKAGGITNWGFGFDEGTGVSFLPRGRCIGIWFNAFAPSVITKWQLHGAAGSTMESSPWWGYSFYTTDYPAKSGWIRKWIDPTAVTLTESAGTQTWNFRTFGIRLSTTGAVGSSDNTRVDAMHYTTGSRGGGLLVDSGTVPSPATFADFIAYDPDTVSNRQGVVEDAGGAVLCYAQLWIGDATATIFNDTGTTLLFADHNTGGSDTVRDDFMGLYIDLQAATTDVDINGAVIKSGASPLGSLYVLTDAAAGSCNFDGCTFSRLRGIYMPNDVVITNSVFDECGQLQLTNGDTEGLITFNGSSQYIETQTTVDMSSTSDDFEIIACVAHDSWSPSLAPDTICAQGTGNNNPSDTRFVYRLNANSTFSIFVTDGTASTVINSSALSARLDAGNAGEFLWCRVVYDYDGGTAGGDARASFYYSEQGPDTPWQDITWVALGTGDGTQRSMASTASILMIGVRDSTTYRDYWLGDIKFVTMCKDGFFNTGATGDGDNLFRFDMRTGPDFASIPLQRADDWSSSLTWEANGAPTRTLGGDDVNYADISECTVSNSTSTAAVYINNSTNPSAKWDGCTFSSSGSGHAVELGPDCPSTVTAIGHTYTGYAGTDGDTGDEVVYNNSGKAVTWGVTQGDTPTIREGTGSTTTVSNKVTLTCNCFDSAGVGIEGVRIRFENDSTGALLSNGTTNASGVYSDSNYDFTGILTAKVVARLKGYVFLETTGIIGTSGLTITVTLIDDTVVELP